MKRFIFFILTLCMFSIASQPRSANADWHHRHWRHRRYYHGRVIYYAPAAYYYRPYYGWRIIIIGIAGIGTGAFALA